MSIPHLFRCPISLDLFTDPVTLSTGQTYDRCSIQKWLQDGNWTCPVTMQPLQDTSLVPNHTLKHLIQQWLLTGLDPNNKVQKPEPVLELSLSAIKHILQSESATSGAKIEVLRKVGVLTVESDVGRACLIQLGFVPLLLELIFKSPLNSSLLYDSESLELLDLSLDCILTLLPSTHLDSFDKFLINESKLLPLLNQTNAKIKTSVCYLLEIIATSAETQELAISIGQLPSVMHSLVADVASSEASVRAIHALCSLEANRNNAIEQGAINGLMKYLSNYNNSTKKKSSSPKALATLEALVGVEIGKRTLVKIVNCVQVLVKHVFVISSENAGSEFAVSVLLVLCKDSARVRGEIVNAGALTQLLLLIQSQCSVRAKNKARALLKLLRLKCIRGCDEKL